MIYYNALWNEAHRVIHALLKNGDELGRLSAVGDPVQHAIARAALGARTPRLPAAEEMWRTKIETLRAAMSRSSEPLAIADYGARSPIKKLSDEEMYAGRIVTRTLGEVCRSSSKPPKWSLFLFRLVRTLKPAACLELGTCLGISGAYIGAAMQMNGSGRLVTIEGAEALAERSKKNFESLGLQEHIEVVTGRFQDVLPSALEKADAYDIVFIDGHHDGPSTIRYFETIAPSLRDDAIVIFDDIAWSKEMHDAWTALCGHARVRFSVDMFDMGVCCIGRPSRERFRVAV